MDPKTIEMNNLRVLNDYLNQTIEALVRPPRAGQPSYAGFSPFSGVPATPGPIGTDTVYGPWQAAAAYSPFGPQSPFAGLPLYGAAFTPADPFLAHRGFGAPGFAPGFTQSYTQGFAPSLGGWQQPWGPMVEASRQAHINQALAAKQSVLEAMCRACGIPV